jgi:hypothetical protein
MTQHFTRNTVEAPFWCGKCKKFTPHRIDQGRKGPCLGCIEKYDAEKNVIDLDELRRKLGPKQSSLFHDAT